MVFDKFHVSRQSQHDAGQHLEVGGNVGDLRAEFTLLGLDRVQTPSDEFEIDLSIAGYGSRASIPDIRLSRLRITRLVL